MDPIPTRTMSLALTTALLITLPLTTGQGLAEAKDRIPVEREAEEYYRYHERMRGFQEAIRDVLKHALEEDMEAVAHHARSALPGNLQDNPQQDSQNSSGDDSSRAARQEVTPQPFQDMMRATHSNFQDLANDAHDLDDLVELQQRLVQIKDVCIACHSAYRFEKR
ncbi:MAG: hypothetical protein LLP51_08500 [Halorhodospira halophila]|uniref:hypothetical protein n=1 Tax=Halorhodospira halophila TaxID=1053 RepID=UPI0026F10367|nr:hypothetical protein [Halorhodospira halophila]MCC3751420.1 hypothetical protein [Halorhodospira halophila]